VCKISWLKAIVKVSGPPQPSLFLGAFACQLASNIRYVRCLRISHVLYNMSRYVIMYSITQSMIELAAVESAGQGGSECTLDVHLDNGKMVYKGGEVRGSCVAMQYSRPSVSKRREQSYALNHGSQYHHHYHHRNLHLHHSYFTLAGVIFTDPEWSSHAQAGLRAAGSRSFHSAAWLRARLRFVQYSHACVFLCHGSVSACTHSLTSSLTSSEC